MSLSLTHSQMPRSHHRHLPRRCHRLLLLLAVAATLLLLLLLVLPKSPPAKETTTLRLHAAIAAHPSPASFLSPCSTHLSLSLHRLHSAAAAISRHDPLSALHLAAASLQYQYDCSHLLSRAPFPSHPLTSILLSSLSLTAAGGGGSRRGGRGRGGDAFPARIRPDVSVCKTAAGACHYTTIQAAVAAAPNFTTSHFVISVAAGIYRENLIIPYEKTNIVLVGGGIGVTVITAALHAEMDGLTTYDTATVAVLGDGFRVRDITVENRAGAGAHQAVAFRSDSDRSVLENVEFRGHQDTVYARSLRQLYRRCRIVGTVDFIFGNAAAVFEDCVIETVPRLERPEKGARNVVAANGRIDPGQPTGFVFRNCTVDGSAEYLTLYRAKPRAYRLYLGRPWKEYARTVYVGCYLGEAVRPEGWLAWRGDFALQTLYYGEFRSWGPGMNDTARVEWSSQIPEEHVVLYSVENFIQGHEWIAY